MGDVLPITSRARVLVMLEQFAGVAYIAVVVSRLIGLTIVRQDRKDKFLNSHGSGFSHSRKNCGVWGTIIQALLEMRTG